MGAIHYAIGWLNHLILLQLYQEKKNDLIEYCLPLESLLKERERAFGVLKAGWRCLLTALDANIENVPDVIICCLILHNFAK